MVHFSHLYMTSGKTIALTMWAFFGKVMSLLFNMFRFVIAFFPRSKRLLISWLESSFAVILGAQENKFCHYLHCFSIYLPWSDGIGCHDLSFWILSFKPTFWLLSFTFIERLFSSLLSAIRVVSSACLRWLIFLPAVMIPACRSSSPAFHMMLSA